MQRNDGVYMPAAVVTDIWQARGTDVACVARRKLSRQTNSIETVSFIIEGTHVCDKGLSTCTVNDP